MNLIIDAGNQRIKLGIYKQHELIATCVLKRGDSYPAELDLYAIDYAISSNTGIDAMLNNIPVVPTLSFMWNTPVPVINEYASPETLGRDRIAAVIGARTHVLNKNPNILVIDAGTCITYDLLLNQSYKGGSISPGLTMRLKAMHHFTAKLPEVPLELNVPLVANSTFSGMQSGAFYGMLHEIQGYISHYQKLYPDIQIFITGGDMPYFEKHLETSIFAHPNLVLDGLNHILNYNKTALLGS
jgi:type III pantothenate kinase